jgi:hypothetical protein
MTTIANLGRETPRNRAARRLALWLAVLAIALGAARVGAQEAAPEAAAVPQVEAPAAAEETEKPGEQWIRVLHGDDGRPTAMQTAIVRYRAKGVNGNDEYVDLVGAIHVGDMAYYENLNKEFEQYDSLLYELVAEQGTVIPRDAEVRSTHPVGAIQNGMKDLLGLSHQLQGVDYTKENFVHADMSPDEFSKAMKDRGESFLELFFRMMGQAMAQQSKLQAEGKGTSDFAMLFALFAPDRDLRLKQIMADQFQDMESILTGLDGPDGTTLISGRNEVALKVLKSEMDAGKKKLGVFYGAGHLADMDKRLRADFGLEPVEVRWLTAWDMTPKDEK